MEQPSVLTGITDGILVMTINREHRRNALDPQTSRAMEEILNEAEKNPEVRVIVLTGAGERSFCSGEDLAAFSENGECQTVMAHGFGGMTARVCPKPVLCAANGACVAGGFEIALACDLIIAAEHARFGLTEVKVGLLATTGGLARLSRDIPRKAAMEMVLTGNLITAKRAWELGLVNEVVPGDQVLERTLEIARVIAANAPLSLKLSKEIMHVAQQTSLEDAQRFCDRCWDYIEKTEDAREGPQAFLEKRPPRWQGR